MIEELMTDKRDAPFGRLRYLYMGTSDVQKDVDYYTKVLGAKKIWDISSFGTRVAALALESPLFDSVRARSFSSQTIDPRLAAS